MSCHDNHNVEEALTGRQRAQSSDKVSESVNAEGSTGGAHQLSPALLGSRHLGGRGLSSVRAALMRAMQSTHGNRAVQRTIQVQRMYNPFAAAADYVEKKVEAVEEVASETYEGAKETVTDVATDVKEAATNTY